MSDIPLKIGDRVFIPAKNMAASKTLDDADRVGILVPGESWDTRRIRFDDTGRFSRSYYTFRFVRAELTFGLDFQTTNVDDAIKAAQILATALGQPVGVKNV